jgi:hypothetical protein
VLSMRKQQAPPGSMGSARSSRPSATPCSASKAVTMGSLPSSSSSPTSPLHRAQTHPACLSAHGPRHYADVLHSNLDGDKA